MALLAGCALPSYPSFLVRILLRRTAEGSLGGASHSNLAEGSLGGASHSFVSFSLCSAPFQKILHMFGCVQMCSDAFGCARTFQEYSDVLCF